MTSDKEIKAYVRQYHEDGRLEELPPVLVTHCMIKGYIECHLMFAGYITIQLTTLGETWLYHTDNGNTGAMPTEYSLSAGTEETMGWQETGRRTGAGTQQPSA